jgi:hypothetical protein
MSHRGLVSAIALAIVMATLLIATVPMAAQAPAAQAGAPQPATFTTASKFVIPKATFTLPKTPWGDPDIQGYWDYQGMIPMQRPPALAGKKVFTEAEHAEFAKDAMPNQDSCGVGTRKDEVCSEDELKSVGAYNEFWNNRNVVKDLRTSLIEDPDDGRIPPLTPEAAAISKQLQLQRRKGGDAVYNSWTDWPGISRCIAEQTPNGVQMYNSGTYIQQVPGWILIVRERLDTRVIAMDGRPHPSPKVTQWNGHSVGKWEGDTLVVDTRNFTNRQNRGGVGSTIPGGVPMGNIHLVEHFVPVSATRISYYATIEDPKTWVRPWTFMLPWERDPSYKIYEYACHEANISVGNGLRGERELDALEGRK